MSTLTALERIDEFLTELEAVDWETVPLLDRCRIREELPVLGAYLAAVRKKALAELARREAAENGAAAPKDGT